MDTVGGAFALGGLSQASLLGAGLFAVWVTVPRKVVGVLAGFGAGAMLAAVSFDLVAEAEELSSFEFSLWALGGVAVFLLGDLVVERRFGDSGEGGALGIVVGSVVDGVPESAIFGIQLATGFPLSASLIAAVLVSNIPQALAPSAELAEAGWGVGRLARLWLLVILACAVAAAAGFAVADVVSSANGERMAALAAGGLLAMLTGSLIPFSYERAGQLAGIATVIGFCASLGST
jgi:ZIP family zinc transporter